MKTQSAAAILAFVHFGVLVTTAAAQQPAPKKLDPRIYEPYLGSYQTPSGDFIVVGRSVRRLIVFEPSTRRLRGLRPASDTSTAETLWSAGPSLLVYSPASYQIKFNRSKTGAVTSLVLKEPGHQDRVAVKAHLYSEEEVTFHNGDVSLAGKLLIPNSPGPHPAVIFLHGSGAQDRNGENSEIRFTADHFARHGFATLIYDKRGLGVAGSTGNLATATFKDFATDALAGLEMLKNRRDIDPRRIGLWGISQAGWVMMTATTMSNDIAFIISVSAGGSGYTIPQQNNYNIASDMRSEGFATDVISRVITSYNLFYDVIRAGEGGDGAKLDSLVQKLSAIPKLKDWLPPLSSEIDWKKRDQWYTTLDINLDPAPLWAKFDGPVLGIFGELDTSTPAAEVVPIFSRALAGRRNTDFAVKVFPHANHDILEAETGSESELPRLKMYAAGYFDTMTDWLRTRAMMRTPRR